MWQTKQKYLLCKYAEVKQRRGLTLTINMVNGDSVPINFPLGRYCRASLYKQT